MKNFWNISLCVSVSGTKSDSNAVILEANFEQLITATSLRITIVHLLPGDFKSCFRLPEHSSSQEKKEKLFKEDHDTNLFGWLWWLNSTKKYTASSRILLFISTQCPWSDKKHPHQWKIHCLAVAAGLNHTAACDVWSWGRCQDNCLCVICAMVALNARIRSTHPSTWVDTSTAFNATLGMKTTENTFEMLSTVSQYYWSDIL